MDTSTPKIVILKRCSVIKALYYLQTGIHTRTTGRQTDMPTNSSHDRDVSLLAGTSKNNDIWTQHAEWEMNCGIKSKIEYIAAEQYDDR